MLELKTIEFLRKHSTMFLILLYLTFSSAIGLLVHFVLDESWSKSAIYSLITLALFSTIGLSTYYSDK